MTRKSVRVFARKAGRLDFVWVGLQWRRVLIRGREGIRLDDPTLICARIWRAAGGRMGWNRVMVRPEVPR